MRVSCRVWFGVNLGFCFGICWEREVSGIGSLPEGLGSGLRVWGFKGLGSVPLPLEFWVLGLGFWV